MKMFRTKGYGPIRRGLAWILAAGLMAGALGGCQKKDGGAGGMSGETQQVGQITAVHHRQPGKLCFGRSERGSGGEGTRSCGKVQ